MASTTATSPEEYATDAEVTAAIASLSVADGVRISKVAGFRARGLAALGVGVNAEDLIQEAVSRTLHGERRWRKSVKIVTHLIKTISSVASHIPDELKGGTTVPSTTDDADGRMEAPLLLASGPDPERAVAAAEQLRRIATQFKDDTEVGLVVEGLANGMTGPEIKADLQLTQTQYETIMTRLRRGVDRREGWRP